MPIKFSCGSCSKAYKVPDHYSGKRIRCKSCDEVVHIPSVSDAAVTSTRAEQVSTRSVLASQRVEKTSGKAKSVSGRNKAVSGRAATSGRTSARTPAASTAAPPRKAKVGSQTERLAPVDLTEGNQIKDYQKKREEEFKKGEGRCTYFEEGKPKKAFRLTKKDTLVGRGESCDISLPLASLSGEHMKIEYKLGTFIATDLQSTNGVMVNGRMIRRSALKSGDIIQLGEAILRIDY